jgi:hypothetical protein
MMNPETTMLLVNAVIIGLAYAFIYPRFAGNNVSKLAWYDVGVSIVPLLIAWYWYAEDAVTFNMVFFQTNWFMFTLITYFILELPMSIGYMRRIQPSTDSDNSSTS